MRRDVIKLKVLKRLLREASNQPTANGRAAYVYRHGQGLDAILYSTNAYMEFLRMREMDPQEWEDKSFNTVSFFVDEVIKGYIWAEPHKDPCWGAWEVKAIASGDDAKSTYGLGYAMSSVGTLTSDRTSVSDKARGAWMNIFKGKKRKTRPLDDVSVPEEQRQTPGFPDDDCQLFRGKDGSEAPNDNPQLQYAYESQGWEDAFEGQVRKNHSKFRDAVGEEFGEDAREEIHELLSNMTDHYWDVHFNDMSLGPSDL